MEKRGGNPGAKSLSFSLTDIPVPKAALIIAMSETREAEAELRRQLEQVWGYRCAATELGGVVENFRDKIIQAAVAAAVNNGVIDKVPGDIHALVHAVVEAQKGVLVEATASPSVYVKVGIAADDSWLAVAIYGESALHVLSNHARAGLGVTHFHRGASPRGRG